MSGNLTDTDLVRWARDLAAFYLRDAQPQRWAHVQGVALQAEMVSRALTREDGSVLVAAAYLHDVGYGSQLVACGAHQIDGAAMVRSQGAERIARLVAHHSEAKYELSMRGFGETLATYEEERSSVSDCLTYCDLTTAPDGQVVTVGQRLAEIEDRFSGGLVVDALRRAKPALLAAVDRTEARLRVAEPRGERDGSAVKHR